MNANEEVPYVAKFRLKHEDGLELPYPSPAFQAADDAEAIELAIAWAHDNKPDFYEAIRLELWHGDALIKKWPVAAP